MLRRSQSTKGPSLFKTFYVVKDWRQPGFVVDLVHLMLVQKALSLANYPPPAWRRYQSFAGGRARRGAGARSTGVRGLLDVKRNSAGRS